MDRNPLDDFVNMLASGVHFEAQPQNQNRNPSPQSQFQQPQFQNQDPSTNLQQQDFNNLNLNSYCNNDNVINPTLSPIFALGSTPASSRRIVPSPSTSSPTNTLEDSDNGGDESHEFLEPIPFPIIDETKLKIPLDDKTLNKGVKMGGYYCACCGRSRTRMKYYEIPTEITNIVKPYYIQKFGEWKQRKGRKAYWDEECMEKHRKKGARPINSNSSSNSEDSDMKQEQSSLSLVALNEQDNSNQNNEEIEEKNKKTNESTSKPSTPKNSQNKPKKKAPKRNTAEANENNDISSENTENPDGNSASKKKRKVSNNSIENDEDNEGFNSQSFQNSGNPVLLPTPPIPLQIPITSLEQFEKNQNPKNASNPSNSQQQTPIPAPNPNPAPNPGPIVPNISNIFQNLANLGTFPLLLTNLASIQQQNNSNTTNVDPANLQTALQNFILSTLSNSAQNNQNQINGKTKINGNAPLPLPVLPTKSTQNTTTLFKFNSNVNANSNVALNPSNIASNANNLNNSKNITQISPNVVKSVQILNSNNLNNNQADKSKPRIGEVKIPQNPPEKNEENKEIDNLQDTNPENSEKLEKEKMEKLFLNYEKRNIPEDFSQFCSFSAIGMVKFQLLEKFEKYLENSNENKDFFEKSKKNFQKVFDEENTKLEKSKKEFDTKVGMAKAKILQEMENFKSKKFAEFLKNQNLSGIQQE